MPAYSQDLLRCCQDGRLVFDQSRVLFPSKFRCHEALIWHYGCIPQPEDISSDH